MYNSTGTEEGGGVFVNENKQLHVQTEASETERRELIFFFPFSIELSPGKKVPGQQEWKEREKKTQFNNTRTLTLSFMSGAN